MAVKANPAIGTVNLGAIKEMARDARGDSERELRGMLTRSTQQVGYQESVYLVCREYIMHHENIRRVERIARSCDAMDKMYRTKVFPS